MSTVKQDQEQFFAEIDDDEESSANVYDITSTPNDFNILTTVSFMESGRVEIPRFQRNFIWDVYRASRLIESLIMGLPVPQVFLYEKEKNIYQIIDGQQRLLSIYYFVKQRFPRKEKSNELRKVFLDEKGIPEHILHDKEYFTDFDLKFKRGSESQFSGLNYKTLGEHKTDFDLRTIRNIIIKQNEPEDDDSSIYEVFNRLNTGGLNLKPQEIRMSMYYSDFYKMLFSLNENSTWRGILGLAEPHPHFVDIEILLRAFSFLMYGDSYKASIARFLNRTSKEAKRFSDEKISCLENIFLQFMENCAEHPEVFINHQRGRFNVALFEAVFTAACQPALDGSKPIQVTSEQIIELSESQEFLSGMQEGTAKVVNVKKRLDAARSIICQ